VNAGTNAGTITVNSPVQGGFITTEGAVYGNITVNGALQTGSCILTAGSDNGTVTISGPVSGQFVTIGNINGNVSTGAVQGGVIATSGSINGNMTIGGSLSGQLLSVGNINGNVTINGGLQSARIADLGSILGNLTISGSVDNQSAIVSGGSIGNTKTGTGLIVGAVNGILASVGSMNVIKIGSTSQALDYKQNDAPDVAVIDEIFSQGVTSLSPTDIFDRTTPDDLLNLAQMLTSLSDVTVQKGKLAL
jgi:hypothetical protein